MCESSVAAERPAAGRFPPAFLIDEAEPTTHVPAEDAIFFDQVGHGLLLPLVEPADQRCQEPAERRRVEHGGKVYTTARSQGPEDPRPSNETLRASISAHRNQGEPRRVIRAVRMAAAPDTFAAARDGKVSVSTQASLGVQDGPSL